MSMETKIKVNPFNHQQKRFGIDTREVEMGDRSPNSSDLNEEYQGLPIQYEKFKSPLRTKISKSWIRNKGLAYMLGAQLFNCLMNIAITVLEVEGNYHPVQILFVRMGITVVLASSYMARQKIEDFPFGKKEVRWLLLARGLGGYVGVFGMYYSLIYLPLADATVLTFISPVLGCWLCAHILKEPFGTREKLAALVSFVGVVFIAQPSAIFDHNKSSSIPTAGIIVTRALQNATTHIVPSESEGRVITSRQKGIAIAVALLGCLGGTVVITALRWIGRRAHPLISVNYFATCATIVSGVAILLIPSIGGFTAPKTIKEWSLLVFLGICGFTSQTMSATGMGYEKSARATNMIYTSAPMSFIFDLLIFGHKPTPLSLIGSSMILLSAIFVAMRTQIIGEENKDRSGQGTTDEERGSYGLLTQERDSEDAEGDVPMRELTSPSR